MTRTKDCWVIRATFDWGDSLLGVYNFGGLLPDYIDACRIAVFRTRALARGACASLCDYTKTHNRPRVVRAKLTVSAI